MEPLTESPHAGEFIRSEANGLRSRENVTIAEGQTLQAGTVLGKVTSSGKYTQLDQNAGTGEEVAAAILLAKCDASAADTAAAVIARDAEVIADSLVWPDSSPEVDKDQAESELNDVGIILRQST